MPPTIFIKDHKKYLHSPEINYIFDMRSGMHAVWGKDVSLNPEWSPCGPFIADIEVTTSCNGVEGKLCEYCYKSNTPHGKNMPLVIFQQVIRNINFNNQLTQVAFGLDAAAESNSELWAMSEWLRSINIIPNGTVAAITEDTAKNIAALWGACAVSLHDRKDICYDMIALLTNKIGKAQTTLQQVNMHLVLYEEMFNTVFDILDDIEHDTRLAKLNAVVFLSLKQKGRAQTNNNFTPLSQKHYNEIINACLARHISFGSDSCGCHKVAAAIQGRSDEPQLSTMLEPCEALCMSAYCNVDGIFYPCSFLESLDDVPSCNLLTSDFSSFWLNKPDVIAYRKALLEQGRHCPKFIV